MTESPAAYYRSVIAGRQRGAAASVLRAGLAAVEPFYGMAMRARNWTFDARLRHAHVAARPVVCVGNVTTGGTGKTPVVQWLTNALRQRGHRPAILMRGYKSSGAGGSDEQRLLQERLRDPSLPNVPVVADPDRVRAARRAVECDPQVTVFVLDDGFQHRRLARDFDLVLIDATNPFCHERLLPRGLLREPLDGLRRANALLLTRADAVRDDELAAIERQLRRHNAWAPLYRCRHAHGRFIGPTDQTGPADLTGRRYLAFCGIGNPESFARQLEQAGGRCAATHFFPDHHAYRASDLTQLEQCAAASAADAMITTEKDWVKLRALDRATRTKPPIWRAELKIEFTGDDGDRLVEQVMAAIAPRAASATQDAAKR